MTLKPTLTIAVPAYNEAGNISILLNSILNQKLKEATLKSIVVISDGSVDGTSEIVEKLISKHKHIQLINHKNRRGKVNRLNEIYKLSDTDYLIIFDADILLSGNQVVSNMVSQMITSPQVSMLAAHQIPTRGNTFISRVIYGAYQVWDDTRLSVPERVHIQNFYGAATIYRQSFYKELHIPTSITDERGYIYLKALQNGQFKYSSTAQIFYRPVETLHDLWKLGDRSFGKNQDILAKIFGSRVYSIYQIPFEYKLKSIAKNILRSPVYVSLGLLLNILIRLLPVHDQTYDSGMWEPSISTKKAIKL